MGLPLNVMYIVAGVVGGRIHRVVSRLEMELESCRRKLSDRLMSPVGG